MKPLTKRISAAVLAAAWTTTAAWASGLVWEGTVDNKWDTSTANWDSGASVFTQGADIRFDDTATRFDISMAEGLTVGSLLVDAAATYTLAGANALSEIGTFVKRGTGELRITGKGHTFTNDMLIEGGTLTVAAGNDTPDITSGPLGNPRVPRVITVTTNATLNILHAVPFGAGTSTSPVATDLRIIGGTLNLTTNAGIALNSVLLDNAKLVYNGGGGGWRFWGSATFGSNVTFKGSTPYVFNEVGSNCGFTMGKYVETELWVDDISGDSGYDVTFNLPIRNTPHNNPLTNRDGVDTRFRKAGPGTLRLQYRNDFTGNVSVVEGTLAVDGSSGLNVTSGPLGNPQIARTITVHTNGTLHLLGNDTLGQVWSHPLTEIIINGGTLRQSAGMVNCFGPLTLHNATLSYSGINKDWGTLVFDGDVTFSGTNAYNLATVSSSRLRIGRNRMTFLNVHDIPGADPDVTIGMPIDDCIAGASGGVSFPAMPSNLGKSGPGTLSLSNHGNTFTGNVEVVGGTLLIPSGGNGENKVFSCLGNPQVANRRLLVHSGAELSFRAGNTLGQLASSVKMATVISNATLRLASGTCNGFGPLTLHDATLIYSNGESGWGVLGLGGHTVINGTRPLTFPATSGTSRFSLGYSLGLDIQELPGVTNYVGQTEITVHDITASPATDATFEAPLQDIPTWVNGPLFKTVTFKCGLLKSGEGTLSIASTDNTYTGPTTVTQGVLRVDGSLTTSLVTVKPGGFLGGTGTVGDVTIEPGAGFSAPLGQEAPLTINTLTVDGSGTVDILTDSGTDPTAINVPLFRVTGTATGFTPSAWTVLHNGVPVSANLRLVQASDGTIHARWSPRGTVITLQ